MRRKSVALLLFALALSVPAVSAAAPADPLWREAVAAASRAEAWSPGEVRILIEMADDRGNVLETWDNRYLIAAGPDGTLSTEVVAAIHDGKDETRKEREAQAKRESAAPRDGAGDWTRFIDDPFDPAIQESVTVRRLADPRTIAGTACAAFSFTIAKPKGVSIEGTAWLDAATGVPLEAVSAPQPLPRGVREIATPSATQAGSRPRCASRAAAACCSSGAGSCR